MNGQAVQEQGSFCPSPAGSARARTLPSQAAGAGPPAVAGNEPSSWEGGSQCGLPRPEEAGLAARAAPGPDSGMLLPEAGGCPESGQPWGRPPLR